MRRFDLLGVLSITLVTAVALATLAVESTAQSIPAPAEPSRAADLPNPQAGSVGTDPVTWPLAKGGFVGTASGPAAPLTNPAATGLDPRARMLIAFDFVERRYSGALIYWQPNLITVGYRHTGKSVAGYNEDYYYAAISRKAGGRGGAAEIIWITNDVVEGENALSVGTSAYYRQSARMRLGVLLRHLNRPKYMFGRLERLLVLGVAAKLNPLFDVAGDFIFQKEGDSNFRGRYGIEMEPTPGFFLAASYDSRGAYRFAIALGSDDTQLGWGIENGAGIHRQLVTVGHEDRP